MLRKQRPQRRRRGGERHHDRERERDDPESKTSRRYCGYGLVVMSRSLSDRMPLVIWFESALPTNLVQRKSLLTVIAISDKLAGDGAQAARSVRRGGRGAQLHARGRPSPRRPVRRLGRECATSSGNSTRGCSTARPTRSRSATPAARCSPRRARRSRRRPPPATPSTRSGARCAAPSSSARCRRRGCARSTSPACWPSFAPSTRGRGPDPPGRLTRDGREGPRGRARSRLRRAPRSTVSRRRAGPAGN